MPSINKVVFGNQTLIDLSTTTLSAANQLANGVTAYDRAGNVITGTASGGGGGVTAATGTIVIASEIASPSVTESFVFPGLSLAFQPDFLYISMTNDSYQAIKDTATSHHLYWLAFFKSKSMIPTYRMGNTSNTDDASYEGIEYRVMACNNSYLAESNPTGYGITGVNCVSYTVLPYWALNVNGTMSYGRISNSQQSKLYAGTYRYVAIKWTT